MGGVRNARSNTVTAQFSYLQVVANGYADHPRFPADRLLSSTRLNQLNIFCQGSVPNITRSTRQ